MVTSMKRYIPIALLVFAVYIAFSGGITPHDLLIGVVLAALVSFAISRYIVRDISKASSLKRFIHLVAYALYYLTVAEFEAHRMVIRIILSKSMPIRPAIVRVPYKVRSEYTIVACANSITNTPGTVVVDIDTTRSLYYVHWIYAAGLDPKTTYENILKKFEEKLSRVFE